MNYSTEFRKNYGEPVLAGTYRFLLGIIMLFAGLYISTLTDVQGHGFGLLLILGSPFMVLKDSK